MLIFASATAWMLFGDRLGALGFVGIGVIVVTGIVIAVRSNAADN
jgi:drug/metabolite transporter (DMT)-like permease